MKRSIMNKAAFALAVVALLFTTSLTHPAKTLAASGGPCISPAVSSYAAISSSAGSNRNGASATINPSTSFTNCGDVGFPSSTSAWVGIDGGVANLEHDILQLGIVECDNVVEGVPSYCNANDTTGGHYFYEKSGCAQPAVVGDLGPADFGPHTYTIGRDGSGNWQLWIDNVLKLTISTSDPYIFCWDEASTKRGYVSGERWDAGDSWGLNIDPLVFTNMQFYVNGAWVMQNTGTTCTVTGVTSGTGAGYCSRNGSTMSVWTVY